MKKLDLKSLVIGSGLLPHLLLFSLIINLLMLVPSWYMLEVYDRVLMSRNSTTLLMLALIALLMLAVVELLNHVRAQLLTKMGSYFFVETRELLFDLTFLKGVRSNQPFNTQPIDYLSKVASFISSNVFVSLLDFPFALIFLLMIFLMSPALGVLTLCVSIFLIVVSVLNERNTHPQLSKANQSVYESQVILNNVLRNAEVIKAMGMTAAIEQGWKAKHFEYVGFQSQASLTASQYTAYTKFLQQLLGSAILGLGCFLFLNADFPIGPAGFIIASILATRFTTPFVQIVTGWKHVSGAYDAIKVINQVIEQPSIASSAIRLPAPTGNLSLENVNVRIANTDRFILKNIAFNLRAGQSLAIIGPSGSGKSTLAKLIVGALMPDSGTVRLDGAELFKWNKEEVGSYVGYLPQDIDLYEGTVHENIARFDPAMSEEALDETVALCGLADFIERLPEQGNTLIGPDGVKLPGGKKQLMGLARAIYGDPKLVLLDEPNSNLDKDGEEALINIIRELKKRMTTTVVITHQMRYLSEVDFIIVLVNGEIKVSGASNEVMAKLQGVSEPMAGQLK